jgi:hypothetical protein
MQYTHDITQLLDMKDHLVFAVASYAVSRVSAMVIMRTAMCLI